MKNSPPKKNGLLMRWCKIVILQFIFCTSMFANTKLSQNINEVFINLTIENRNLEYIFSKIEEKTPFQFTYVKTVIPTDKKITFKVENESLQKVLDDLEGKFNLTFIQNNTRILVKSRSLTSINSNAQQTYEVKGKVTDKEGIPLPSASVQIKGTYRGTVTDFDGNFALTVLKSEVLQISFLGYKTIEVPVTSADFLSITLEGDTNTLNEVVVTALNIERAEKTIGYATQTVDGEDLEEAHETNLVNSLNGKIAGVQITNTSGAVGASSSIILRGNRSFSGRNQPLFVVDGVPISNEVHQSSRSFRGPSNPNRSGFLGEGEVSGGEQQVDYGNAASEINPADIESIQVLKGANAAALYGSRAANGVILITTKSGSRKQGLGVSLTSSVSFESPLKTPKFQTQFGKGDNGLYEYNGINSNAGKNFGPRFNGQLIPQYNRNTPNTPVQRPWENRLGDDPIGDFLETGITQTNNISITNGNDKGNFRLSYTRLDQEGMVPNTDLTRNTFGLNADYNLSNKLRVGATVNYINSNSDNRPNIGAKSESNIIFTLLKLGGNESLSDLRDYWEPSRENEQQATSDNKVNNPYFLVYENLNGNKRDRIYGNVNLSYKVTDNFSVKIRSGTDFYSDRRTTIKAKSHIPYENGFYSEANVFYKENNTDILLTYSPNLGNDFSLTTIGGANRLDQKTEQIRGSSGFRTGLVTPGLFNLSNSREIPRASNFRTHKRINSIYGNATFGFRDYLFLDVTARNDWSSTLPKDNNSYFYPSVSVSAVLSDMFNMSSTRTDYLKLRASYAEVGNDTDPYQTNAITFEGGAAEGNSINTISNTLGNVNLEPERIHSAEVGMEAGFFNGRLNFDVTYYQSRNEQQIVSIPLATESGFLNRVINVPAEITNKGLEVQLNVKPIKTPSFIWDINLNWAKNDNEISQFNTPELGDRFTLAERWINLDIVSGGRFGDFFGDYLLKVDENGNLGRVGLQIYRPDGRAEESDDVGSLVDEAKPFLGNGTPDWVAGINNSFTYKNLNFSFLFDMNKGGEVHSRTFVVGNQLGSLQESVELQRRDDPAAVQGAIANGQTVVPGEQWVELNGATIDKSTGETTPQTIYARTSNFYRRYYDNDAVGTFDRTFIKLREVKLTYTFPRSITQPLGLSNASLSLFGRNLLLWDDVPHIDPEVAGYSGELPGGEFFAIPSARSMGMSLNLSF